MNLIVTTTINPPTESLLKFSQIDDWKLIVVGDIKTPHDLYSSINCIYLDPQKQEDLYPKLSKIIGWKKIQRRNIGLVHAHELGAEKIFILDDDNIPMDNWGKNVYIDQLVLATKYHTDNLVFEPFDVLAGDFYKRWMRGYPPQLVENRHFQINNVTTVEEKFDIQQDFWFGSADVDALCRILYDDKCSSHGCKNIPFTSNAFCPVDSQSTFVSRKAIRYFPLFLEVDRFDDHAAGYYCQAHGARVIYNEPTVFQERNEHDICKDMQAEFHSYRNCFNVVNTIRNDPDKIFEFLPEINKQFVKTYQEYMLL